jgi:ketosteroid isomerase-like protein
MRVPRVLSLGFLLVVLLASARADEAAIAAAERAAIRSVIERQIAAFAKDDAAAAFGFASPSIQRQFGTPETFMGMVQSGYRPVYRPHSLSFREATRVEGGVVQEVDVIGADGKSARAFYLMEREQDGSWRINGVSLLPGVEKET